VWGRQHLLQKTLYSLMKRQTVSHRIRLHIWNNNPEMTAQVSVFKLHSSGRCTAAEAIGDVTNDYELVTHLSNGAANLCTLMISSHQLWYALMCIIAVVYVDFRNMDTYVRMW
jgi:hypothetical protein